MEHSNHIQELCHELPSSPVDAACGTALVSVEPTPTTMLIDTEAGLRADTIKHLAYTAKAQEGNPLKDLLLTQWLHTVKSLPMCLYIHTASLTSA